VVLLDGAVVDDTMLRAVFEEDFAFTVILLDGAMVVDTIRILCVLC
jgi:hypothetical protein